MGYLPSSPQEEFELRLACRLWQLRIGYSDTGRELVTIRPEILVSLLSGIANVEVRNASAVRTLIRLARKRRASEVLSPVYVVWDNLKQFNFKVYVPANTENAP